MEAGAILAGKLLDLQIRQTEIIRQMVLGLRVLSSLGEFQQQRHEYGSAPHHFVPHHMIKAEKKTLGVFQSMLRRVGEETDATLMQLKDLLVMAPTGGATDRSLRSLQPHTVMRCGAFSCLTLFSLLL